MVGLSENLPLPALNPLIKLYKGPDKPDGSPTWTLHHPVSNKYFQIGWAEFECLARFHRYEDTHSLVEAVNKKTTVEINDEDVKTLLVFLHTNGLVCGADALAQPAEDGKKQSFWMKILHHYLFFTLPLFRPQKFLKKTYAHVRPLLSRPFLTLSYGLLAVMLLLTLQRADEFLHTFFQLFSFEGAVMIAALFMGIKVLHELGHAYAATKYNVPVPHMGVAFIVLYPVLYTETSGLWRLSSRRARMHVGLAGVATELVIAAYALLLWHILPPGLWQSLAFGVVAISLIGSLLVNLNPLMRFDGYYVLSDALGIENLHSRAITFARWRLRKFIFNLNDPVPEEFSKERKSFLTWFGFAVIVYRFFLFLGIALLVYHMFFQPLGLILMVVEIAWFIALPIWKEFAVWLERREDILSQNRARWVLGGLVALLILTVLPVQNTVSVPAIMHASQYRAVYPPAPSYILELNYKDGDTVQQDAVIARLESMPLKRDLAMAALHLESLDNIKRREQTNSELYRERRGSIDQDIQAARDALDSLKRQQEQLIITAEFDGVIRDMSFEIHPGRSVNPGQLLFRLIKTGQPMVTGYVREDQLARLKLGNKSVFFPDFVSSNGQKLEVTDIASVNAQTLEWPALSSVYSGPIASEIFSENGAKQSIFPRQSLYKIEFSPAADSKNFFENQELVLRGRVKIEAENASLSYGFLRRIGALLIRESGLN